MINEVNQKETHIIVAPAKELLPKELDSFSALSKECKALLEGKNGDRLANLILFNEKVLLFCKGTHGFTINEIHYKSKPYITSDKESDGLWTINISASPRHFQLESINQEDAAEITVIFEKLVNDYVENKLTKDGNNEDSEKLSERKTEEMEGQTLLDELTQKWKKEGPVKKTGLEWLPSSTTTYKLLILLLIIGMVHSISILFTGSYSLSVDRDALIELAEKGDIWANKQLTINLHKETDNKQMMEVLKTIEKNLNKTTGTLLLSQLQNITYLRAKKRILTILIDFGMAKNIEQTFFEFYSQTTQKEIIELSGEIESVRATLLLHQIYKKTGHNLRGIILIVLARKGDIHFLIESYKKGSASDCSNCIEAAMSLPEGMNSKLLKSFLELEKKDPAIAKLKKLLKNMTGKDE